MAVRKFILSFGQSNAGPSPELYIWWQYHAGADLRPASSFARGAYDDKFIMPGLFPGYYQLDLKGRAISGLRVLTAYNPVATGYQDYPGALKAIAATTSSIDVAQFVPSAPTVGGGSFQSFSVIRKLTGEMRIVTSSTTASLAPGATCRFNFSVPLSSAPQAGEQFYYAHVSTAVGAVSGTQTTVTLAMRCGTGVAADAHTYLGCKLRCITSQHPSNVNMELVIASVASNGFQVTVDGTFSQPPHIGDTFAIVPGNDAAGSISANSLADPASFSRWGYFLPWNSCEGRTTTSVLGEVTLPSPFPPGFDYPNTYHIMPVYRTGTGQGLVSRGISYSIGLGLRFKQYFGETFYLMTSDIGGTPLAHNELSSGSTNFVGWHDPNQQCTWSPGESNGNFQRLMDELDMAIASAAKEGDTLECVGLFYVQGEGDGSQSEWANAYESNLREFKKRVRSEVKKRGLWAGDADHIPWIHPQISNAGGYWPYYETVNAAIERLTEEDRYSRTFSMSDAPVKVPDDTAHYNAVGATMLENRAFLAWRSIVETNQASGEAEIAICNLALSHIGDSAEITSIDPPDGSVQATHCARYYPIARDSLLDMKGWSFATKRKSLVSIDNTRSEWAYAYLAPADCTTGFAILPPDSPDDYSVSMVPEWPTNIVMNVAAGTYVPQPFSTETDEFGRAVIYTNQADAVIRYTASGTDASKFSPLFTVALSWHLASMLAGPIIKGDVGAAEAKRCAQMAQYFTGQADESDSGQRMSKPNHIVPWMSGR